jgi:hypothetical protein
VSDRTFAQAQHYSLVDEAKTNLKKIPEHLRGGLLRYLDAGIEPGRFLCSVLDNDLCEAALRCSDDPARADATLHQLCSFLWNFAPSRCHGSKEKRLAWQAEVSALFARDSETADTEPPAEPFEEIPALEVPVDPTLMAPVGGVVFAPNDETRFGPGFSIDASNGGNLRLEPGASVFRFGVTNDQEPDGA